MQKKRTKDEQEDFSVKNQNLQLQDEARKRYREMRQDLLPNPDRLKTCSPDCKKYGHNLCLQSYNIKHDPENYRLLLKPINLDNPNVYSKDNVEKVTQIGQLTEQSLDDWIAQSFNRSLYSMIDTTKKYHIPEAYVNNIQNRYANLVEEKKKNWKKVYNPYYFEDPNNNGVVSFKDAHNPNLFSYKMMKPKIVEGDPVHQRELQQIQDFLNRKKEQLNKKTQAEVQQKVILPDLTQSEFRSKSVDQTQIKKKINSGFKNMIRQSLVYQDQGLGVIEKYLQNIDVDKAETVKLFDNQKIQKKNLEILDYPYYTTELHVNLISRDCKKQKKTQNTSEKEQYADEQHDQNKKSQIVMDEKSIIKNIQLKDNSYQLATRDDGLFKIIDMTEFLNSIQNSLSSYEQLALNQMKKSKYLAACDYMIKSIQHDDYNYFTLILFGLCLYFCGMFKKSIQILEICLKNPQSQQYVLVILKTLAFSAYFLEQYIKSLDYINESQDYESLDNDLIYLNILNLRFLDRNLEAQIKYNSQIKFRILNLLDIAYFALSFKLLANRRLFHSICTDFSSRLTRQFKLIFPEIDLQQEEKLDAFIQSYQKKNDEGSEKIKISDLEQIKQMTVFKKISMSNIKTIMESSKFVSYEKGQSIFPDPNKVLIIICGYIQALDHSKNYQTPQIQALYQSGDYLIISQQKSQEIWFQCQTKVSLIRISKKLWNIIEKSNRTVDFEINQQFLLSSLLFQNLNHLTMQKICQESLQIVKFGMDELIFDDCSYKRFKINKLLFQNSQNNHESKCNLRSNKFSNITKMVERKFRNFEYKQKLVHRKIFAKFVTQQSIFKKVSKFKADGIYFILKGECQVVDENGQVYTNLGKGDYFGESLIIKTRGYNYYGRIISKSEEVQCLFIHYSKFYQLSNQDIQTMQKNIEKRQLIIQHSK